MSKNVAKLPRRRDRFLEIFGRSSSQGSDSPPSTSSTYDKLESASGVSRAPVSAAEGDAAHVASAKRTISTPNTALGIKSSSSQVDPKESTVRVVSTRNLSEEAFQALSIETQVEVRKLIPEPERALSSILIPKQIKALIDIIKTKQDECEKKFWKINIFGHEVVIRDYVNATLNILKQVGDVAVNFAPAPGSIVWSAVKTLMEMYVAGEAELCVLLMVAQKITPVLYRVQAYELLFNLENIQDHVFENLQSISVKVYSTCYHLIGHASRELASKLRRARHALLEPGKTTDMITKLKVLEEEHDKEVELCRTRLSIESAGRLEGTLRDLRGLKASITSTEESIKMVKPGIDRLVASDKQVELDWISEVQFTEHLNSQKEKMAPNTGNWLLKHDMFKEWQYSDSSTLFWLQGTVGTGKSVLSSSVIQHLQESFLSSAEDGGLAFFFCDRQSATRMESSSILRSFVRQLSTTYKCQYDMREDLHVACVTARNKASKLDEKTCLTQLEESVMLYPTTVIVLDGLDECDEKHRETLLGAVDALMSKGRLVKMFVASRPTTDLQDRFNKKRDFMLETTDNVDDIKTYVTQSVESTKAWTPKEVSSETRKLVVTTLTDDQLQNRPMFQWVYLQLQQLFKCKSNKAIKHRLGELPRSLEESYEEIYKNNTKELDSFDKAHVDRALMWVMCTNGHFTSDNLLAAVRLTPRGTVDNEVVEKTLLDLCQHLLFIETSDGSWRFPHSSVIEYLQKHHWTLAKAHSYIAKVCLSHLLTLYKKFEPLSLPNTGWVEEEPDMPQHYIQKYMRADWHRHVQAVEKEVENEPHEAPDPELIQLFKQFLNGPMESSTQYQKWLDHVIDEAGFAGHSSDQYYVQELRPSSIALFSMARYSFTALVPEWWEDADVSVKNETGSSLFALARTLKVCEILKKRGLSANEPDSRYGSALGAAIMRGNFEIIEFLVNNASADVNMELDADHGSYGSALAAAVGLGHVDIAKFLVSKGAEMNMALKHGYHGSALAAAVVRGNLEIVKFLVEEGKADVDMPLEIGRCGSALAVAAEEHQTDIVEYFVHEAKANVNMMLQNGIYGNALAAATHNRVHDSSMVRFLVEEADADVNMHLHHGSFGSALAAAAAYTRTLDIVKYILEAAEHDVNEPLEHGDYGSVLAAAAAWDLRNVKYLVEEAKADVDMPLLHGKYKSALAAAEQDGNEDIVEYLKAQTKVTSQ